MFWFDLLLLPVGFLLTYEGTWNSWCGKGQNSTEFRDKEAVPDDIDDRVAFIAITLWAFSSPSLDKSCKGKNMGNRIPKAAVKSPALSLHGWDFDNQVGNLPFIRKSTLMLRVAGPLCWHHSQRYTTMERETESNSLLFRECLRLNGHNMMYSLSCRHQISFYFQHIGCHFAIGSLMKSN